MFIDFSIKDLIDILLVAYLLYQTYRLMKDSGSINIFIGILVFIGIWLIVSQVLEMKLLGSIFDKLVSVGVLALIILFQDDIRRFLVTLGSHKQLGRFFRFLTGNVAYALQPVFSKTGSIYGRSKKDICRCQCRKRRKKRILCRLYLPV